MAARPRSWQKDLGLLEVFALAGGAEEFHQADFYLFMAGRLLELARRGAEGVADEVGALKGDIEERAFAGRPKVGDGGFIEVANIVELMAAGKFRPAGGAEEVDAAFGVDGAGGVKIAIGLLGGGNFGNEGVEILVELGVGLDGQGIGGAFNDFIHVGIVEGDTAEGAGHELAGFGEVIDAAGLFALLEVVPDGGQAIGLHARGPEAVVHADSGERDGLERVVFDVCGESGRGDGGRKEKGVEVIHNPMRPLIHLRQKGCRAFRFSGRKGGCG